MPMVRYAEVAAEAWRPGQTMRPVVGAAPADAGLSIQHFRVQPGSATPLHVHDVEEVIVVLAGRLRVRLGDTHVNVSPDAVCVIPAGEPHEFEAIGPDATAILTVFPVPDPISPAHTTYLEGTPPARWP